MRLRRRQHKHIREGSRRGKGRASPSSWARPWAEQLKNIYESQSSEPGAASDGLPRPCAAAPGSSCRMACAGEGDQDANEIRAYELDCERDVPGVGVLTFQYVADPEGNMIEVQHWKVSHS